MVTGTIRRHLEASARPALVVLCAASGPEAALLAALAPLYFPRGAREADAARWRLAPAPPADRRIRIIHNPHDHNAHSGTSTTLYSLLTLSTLSEADAARDT